MEDRLVIVCPPGHPFFGRSSVRPEELSGQAMVLREEGSGTRAHLEEALRGCGVACRPAWVCSSTEAILDAVRHGFGISVLSRRLVRADLDAVIIGAGLSQGGDVAQAVKDYYSSANEYDRAYQFIALTFGDVNTGNTTDFANEVYQAATQDTGMQLLLYLNGMWVSDGWTIAEEASAPLQGACQVFAEYLSGAVNGDKVKSDSDTRMITMAGDQLSQFLSAMGDDSAASAALSANDGESETANSGSTVSEIFSGAAQGFQSGFSLQVFEIVLLVIGAGALMMLLICIVMLVRRR